MNTQIQKLEQLKKDHLVKAREKFNQLPFKNVRVGIDGIEDRKENAEILNANYPNIMNGVSNDFINALNSDEYNSIDTTTLEKMRDDLDEGLKKVLQEVSHKHLAP